MIWPSWIYKVMRREVRQCDTTRRISIDGGPWLEVWA